MAMNEVVTIWFDDEYSMLALDYLSGMFFVDHLNPSMHGSIIPFICRKSS